VENKWLAITISSAIAVEDGTSPDSDSSTAASTLIIPAPAPTRPADGMNVLVSCSAAFVSRGVI